MSSVMRGRRRSSRAETSARGRPITSSGHRKSSSFAYTSRRLLIASAERLTKRVLESQRSGAFGGKIGSKRAKDRVKESRVGDSSLLWERDTSSSR